MLLKSHNTAADEFNNIVEDDMDVFNYDSLVSNISRFFLNKINKDSDFFQIVLLCKNGTVLRKIYAPKQENEIVQTKWFYERLLEANITVCYRTESEKKTYT